MALHVVVGILIVGRKPHIHVCVREVGWGSGWVCEAGCLLVLVYVGWAVARDGYVWWAVTVYVCVREVGCGSGWVYEVGCDLVLVEVGCLLVLVYVGRVVTDLGWVCVCCSLLRSKTLLGGDGDMPTCL